VWVKWRIAHFCYSGGRPKLLQTRAVAIWVRDCCSTGRICMMAPARRILGVLTAAVLVLAVVSGECLSCRATVFASSRRGACCTPDGRCKTSSHNSPSDRCLKAHNSQLALIKQGVQAHPVVTASTLEVAERTDPVLTRIEAPAPLTGKYSPPEPYLLNSVFLI
jgi:hypothetical protein